MIDRRFGLGTWDGIIEERKRRIEEHKEKQKKLRGVKAKQKEANFEKLKKVGEVFVGIISLVIVVSGIAFLINYIKK